MVCKFPKAYHTGGPRAPPFFSTSLFAEGVLRVSKLRHTTEMKQWSVHRVAVRLRGSLCLLHRANNKRYKTGSWRAGTGPRVSERLAQCHGSLHAFTPTPTRIMGWALDLWPPCRWESSSRKALIDSDEQSWKGHVTNLYSHWPWFVLCIHVRGNYIVKYISILRLLSYYHYHQPHLKGSHALSSFSLESCVANLPCCFHRRMNT